MYPECQGSMFIDDFVPDSVLFNYPEMYSSIKRYPCNYSGLTLKFQGCFLLSKYKTILSLDLM